MTYTNSPLVVHKRITNNRTSPRNHAIDTITIHCVVGQCTAEGLGDWFYKTSTQASSNYGVDKDGRVGMYVEEKDRSWCTSSRANDHRAITIEVASDKTHPYAVNDKAYNALIKLVADICKRNGKTKILWFNDKEKSLAYTPKSDEMLMTIHRWFSDTACPGQYLLERHSDIAAKVNAILNAETPKEEVPQAPEASQPAEKPKTIQVGDVVKIAAGSVYYGMTKKVPSWVIAKQWIVKSVKGDRIVVDKAADGSNAICSPVHVKDLTIVQTSTPAPVEPQKPATAPKKKSNEEIAKEVILGRWGNGAARKQKLEAAGYNYREVQNIVNKMLR